jgi:hydrogenase-4 component B
MRRSDPWDCGYPEQDARMQDTAEGFGQPIRQIFEPFMRVEREPPIPSTASRTTQRRIARQALVLAL